MRRLPTVAIALLAIACSTHETAACLPPCDADDRADFAACVASGEGECAAGNRRCCALAAECLGPLEDQLVTTTDTTCEAVLEDACWPPCDVEHELAFDACVAGSSTVCSAGDDTCCALAADCLGELGDIVVYADGCCADESDCHTGETCDVELWTCSAPPRGCGDGVRAADEECDDGNTITESCAYGQMSCAVCDASCHQVQGATSYCGDFSTDSSAGEECDPPDMVDCDFECRFCGAAGCFSS